MHPIPCLLNIPNLSHQPFFMAHKKRIVFIFANGYIIKGCISANILSSILTVAPSNIYFGGVLWKGLPNTEVEHKCPEIFL